MGLVIKRQELFTLAELVAITGYSLASLWRHTATADNPDRILKSMTHGNGRKKRITRASIEAWYRHQGALGENESLPDDWGMDIQFEED